MIKINKSEIKLQNARLSLSTNISLKNNFLEPRTDVFYNINDTRKTQKKVLQNQRNIASAKNITLKDADLSFKPLSQSSISPFKISSFGTKGVTGAAVGNTGEGTRPRVYLDFYDRNFDTNYMMFNFSSDSFQNENLGSTINSWTDSLGGITLSSWNSSTHPSESNATQSSSGAGTVVSAYGKKFLKVNDDKFFQNASVKLPVVLNPSFCIYVFAIGITEEDDDGDDLLGKVKCIHRFVDGNDHEIVDLQQTIAPAYFQVNTRTTWYYSVRITYQPWEYIRIEPDPFAWDYDPNDWWSNQARYEWGYGRERSEDVVFSITTSLNLNAIDLNSGFTVEAPEPSSFDIEREVTNVKNKYAQHKITNVGFAIGSGSRKFYETVAKDVPTIIGASYTVKPSRFQINNFLKTNTNLTKRDTACFMSGTLNTLRWAPSGATTDGWSSEKGIKPLNAFILANGAGRSVLGNIADPNDDYYRTGVLTGFGGVSEVNSVSFLSDLSNSCTDLNNPFEAIDFVVNTSESSSTTYKKFKLFFVQSHTTNASQFGNIPLGIPHIRHYASNFDLGTNWMNAYLDSNAAMNNPFVFQGQWTGFLPIHYSDQYEISNRIEFNTIVNGKKTGTSQLNLFLDKDLFRLFDTQSYEAYRLTRGLEEGNVVPFVIGLGHLETGANADLFLLDYIYGIETDTLRRESRSNKILESLAYKYKNLLFKNTDDRLLLSSGEKSLAFKVPVGHNFMNIYGNGSE